jgi:hypothetical protein
VVGRSRSRGVGGRQDRQLREPNQIEICGDRAVMMPKRRHTRANLQRSITAERRIIDGLVAERDKPPPF